ncbi:MAG: GNAT family N-acetyltransferase [Rhizobiales bacterium]|nr:GNAT family N-acetyltransferase [Hyphomicrobiales bacterium]
MTMAAAIESRVTETRAKAKTTRIANVEIFRDMAAAEQTWRGFEGPDSVLTSYQRFDLLASWHNHIGMQTGVEPLIVVARDAQSEPLMLLPLGVQRKSSATVAGFLGDKHITFNMPICRRDFLATATRGDIDTILDALRAPDVAIDALAFERQPRQWQNLPNPLALLPTQVSVNGCPLMPIEVNAPPTSLISNSFRRRLKSKEKKLQALSGYRYLKAETDADIKRLLDAFFVIKPQRMALQKLPNVFADPGVEEFVRRACHAKLPDGGHAIEIHSLVCDEEVIAIYAGVADGDRFSMMFNTYTLSAHAHFSPGLILMRHIVDRYAALNYTAIDLGIGSDDYKRLFCKSDEPIFDSFIGLNARGRMTASGLSAMAHLKRLVKQTPALMKAAQSIRGSLNR